MSPLVPMEIFSELIGQESVKRLLGGALATGKLAQTMIFAGPKGVGKKTTAQLLAQALHSGDRHSADTFTFSEILNEKRAQDVPSPIKKAIDEVIRFLELSPISSKFKVAIIDDSETLSLASQNALLKTLEEPRPDTILILIAEDEKNLLSTIVSRSRVVRFAPLSHKEIKSILPDISDGIVEASGGSLGFVKEMSANPELWAATKDMRSFWEDINRMSTEDKFMWAENMKDRNDAVGFLRTGAEVLRHRLAQAPSDETAAQLSRIQKAVYQIKDNVNTRAALEALLLVI